MEKLRVNKSAPQQQKKLVLTLTILVSVFLLLHRIWFSPDQFFVFAGILMLLTGRFKNFIKDWTIPVGLLLLYDFLRGFLPHLTTLPHVNPMLRFAMLKGFVSAVALQSMFSNDFFHWYDFFAVLIYMSHWIVPMIVGLFLWLNSRSKFIEYIWSLVILSYLALLTFVLFPTMPPWMAAQNGYILPLKDIYDSVNQYLFPSFYIPTIYQFIDTNLVAAVPSLHAGYPFLTLLFLRRSYPRLIVPLIIYVLSIWVILLYLGEHYDFDIQVALIYALIVYLGVTRRGKIASYFLAISKRLPFNLPTSTAKNR